jgi:hypothetical protein
MTVSNIADIRAVISRCNDAIPAAHREHGADASHVEVRIVYAPGEPELFDEHACNLAQLSALLDRLEKAEAMVAGLTKAADEMEARANGNAEIAKRAQARVAKLEALLSEAAGCIAACRIQMPAGIASCQSALTGRWPIEDRVAAALGEEARHG